MTLAYRWQGFIAEWNSKILEFVLLTKDPAGYPPDLSSLTTRGHTSDLRAQASPFPKQVSWGKEIRGTRKTWLEEKMGIFKVWSTGYAIKMQACLLFRPRESDSEDGAWELYVKQCQ